jgi:hypothetical protein
MEKIQIDLVEENIQDSDITDFEQKYVISLPSNYKILVKKYNGGLVEGTEDLRILFSIKNGNNTVNRWLDVHRDLEHNISEDYLPFGSDVSDNPICLNIKQDDENYGKVFIVYMDGGSLEPVLMANSLEDLLGVEKIEDL